MGKNNKLRRKMKRKNKKKVSNVKKSNDAKWTFKYAIDMLRKNDIVFYNKYEKDINFLSQLTRDFASSSSFFKSFQKYQAKSFYKAITTINDELAKKSILDDTIKSIKELSEDSALKTLDSSLKNLNESLKNVKKPSKSIEKLSTSEIEDYVQQVFEPLEKSMEAVAKAKEAAGEQLKDVDDAEIEEMTTNFEQEYNETFDISEEDERREELKETVADIVKQELKKENE